MDDGENGDGLVSANSEQLTGRRRSLANLKPWPKGFCPNPKGQGPKPITEAYAKQSARRSERQNLARCVLRDIKQLSRSIRKSGREILHSTRTDWQARFQPIASGISPLTHAFRKNHPATIGAQPPDSFLYQLGVGHHESG
jgi:hypothetical protein